MNSITRFAPSPTGLLHVGNLRTALIAWLYAKSVNGKFILRIDDTDLKRCKQEYIDAIKEDLSWIGIDWDLSFHQHSRLSIYEEAKDRLIKSGRLYPCYETEEELALKKKSLLSRKLPPIYDRSSLKLTLKDREELEGRGIRPHWRFLLQKGDISWDDKVRGKLKFATKNLTDPVLIRNNGTLTYSLASVVDDIEYKITDIIRGEDHISNSAIHVQIFEALGAKVPNFSHISLMNTKDKVISKRDGGFDIKNLRENGILPISIINFLSKIGSSENININKRLTDLIKEFNFSKLSKSSVQYNYRDLDIFNKKVIHSLSFAEMKNFIQHLDVCDKIDEKFWISIKNNIDKLSDLDEWWEICKEDIEVKNLDQELIDIAYAQFPDGEITSDTWMLWIDNIKKHTEKRGAKLFLPLRICITGKKNGPELKNILPLIDKAILFDRLKVKKSCT
ncbi:MAG: glutamyl-tRNA synthetase [Candidatus Midichloriaceae bacterium]|jgi:glutamyl-tRNA synthetase